MPRNKKLDPTIDECFAHLRALAIVNRIELHIDPHMPFENAMHVDVLTQDMRESVAHFVIISPARTHASYAIALHEFGHALHPRGVILKKNEVTTLNEQDLKLEEERNAWEWAEENALDWTPEMEAAKRFGLSTYYIGAQQFAQRILRPKESLDDFLKRSK